MHSAGPSSRSTGSGSPQGVPGRAPFGSVAATAARALRLPFVTASVLPFVFGSLLTPAPHGGPFLLGLLAVVCTHLAANLANDFVDSRSGLDARDPVYYGLFGGSKLIVEGRLTAGLYRNLAVGLTGVAGACVLAAVVAFGRLAAVGFFAAILLLAWSYSIGPLRLAHRRLGEAVVFLLFGPATVGGAAYLQTGELSAAALLGSLPFGFLTAAILVANEVPDAADDAATGKRNLVGLLGARRGFILYLALVAAAYLSVVACVLTGAMRWGVLAVLATVPLPLLAARTLRKHFAAKRRLVVSSRLTILLHATVGVVLIAGNLLQGA